MKKINKREIELQSYIDFIHSNILFNWENRGLPEKLAKHYEGVKRDLEIRLEELHVIKTLRNEKI